jgi:hypothetical protein
MYITYVELDNRIKYYYTTKKYNEYNITTDKDKAKKFKSFREAQKRSSKQLDVIYPLSKGRKCVSHVNTNV